MVYSVKSFLQINENIQQNIIVFWIETSLKGSSLNLLETNYTYSKLNPFRSKYFYPKDREQIYFTFFFRT